MRKIGNMQKLYNILFFAISVISYGQVTVLTDVSNKEPKQNESVILTIVQEVVGEDMIQQTPLRLPDLSKFDIIGNASEQNTFIDQKKGIRVNQIVYQYYLQPKTAGKVKIGSALLTVNGKIYKSEPFDITVKEKSESNDNLAKDVFLNLEVEDKNVYENQPTVAILRAYSKDYDNFRKLDNVRIPTQENAKIRAVSYKKEDIEYTDGDYSSQVIATFIIFPEKSGNIEIAPISAVMKSPEINKIVSNKVKLNVKNLPSGSPENFKNAVGKLNVSIENLNKEEHVEINKPTDVIVKISGLGNLDAEKLPKIIESKDYTFYKPNIISKITTIKEGVKGEILAKYIVIPKKEGKVDVKTEHFSFFNPDNNQYVDLGIKSLVLNVLNPEQIRAQKSTIDLVDDYTKNVLTNVPLPVIEKEKHTQKYRLNWGNLLAGLGIVFGGTLLFLFFLKPKKSALQTENLAKPITTISEEEEKLKEELLPDVNTYFEYLKNVKNNQKFSEFFNAYQELNETTKKKLNKEYGMGIKAYIDHYKSSQFADDFRSLETHVSMEKFAPVHDAEHLDELYNNIVKIYSEIMK